MGTIQSRQSARGSFAIGNLKPSAHGDCARHAEIRARLDGRDFDAMSHAFRPHGGFVSGDEVVCRLRTQSDQPLSTLARWIATRGVLNVSWRDQILLPMFQFELEDMSIRPACTRIARELKAVFDDWELALWFAAPNVWLDYAAPVALIADDEFAVLQAARTDRFIARG